MHHSDTCSLWGCYYICMFLLSWQIFKYKVTNTGIRLCFSYNSRYVTRRNDNFSCTFALFPPDTEHVMCNNYVLDNL